MKGTPETPQCGFSRASIQILGLQGVDPAKFTAFNVLEDEELRQGMPFLYGRMRLYAWRLMGTYFEEHC
jgi:glutaredoxin-related protein